MTHDQFVELWHRLCPDYPDAILGYGEIVWDVAMEHAAKVAARDEFAIWETAERIQDAIRAEKVDA